MNFSSPKQSSFTPIAPRVLRWLLLLVLLAASAWLGFLYLGKALCHIAIGQIAELTNTRITAASVNFRSNASVFIKQLAVSPIGHAGPRQTILHAETVYARFSLASILRLKPRLQRIDVNDFDFNAQYDTDTGRWNLSAMKIKPPGPSRQMPLVHLQRGTLRYTKCSQGQVKLSASMPITASFGQLTPKGRRFEITTARLASGFGKSRLEGFWRPGLITIAGGISSADIPELEMAWTIDVIAAQLKYHPDRTFSLNLTIKNLHAKRSLPLKRFAAIGPRTLERSTPFSAIRRFFELYDPRGLVDIELEAAGSFKKPSQIIFNGTLKCKDVAICSRRFPYPIDHLTGQVNFTKDTVSFKNLTGNHGPTTLTFNGWTRGFAPDRTYDIRITSDDLALDDDLYHALSDAQKKLWSAYSPTGRAAVDYRLTRSSPRDKAKYLTLRLQGVNANYSSFPYPLTNLTGTLSFTPGQIVIADVVSESGTRRIVLNGRVTERNTDHPGYHISIKASNIPLDQTLRAALPRKQRDLYDRFSPAGVAGGEVVLSRPPARPDATTFTASLSFDDASLRFDRLPLPVTDITAHALFTPELITIDTFRGRYGSADVSLSGHIQPPRKDQNPKYTLKMKLQQAQLNDDLFDLLPESARKIVTQFQPQGKVNLAANLRKSDPNTPPDYTITADCLGNTMVLPKLSYPLQDVTGTLTVTPSYISLQDIRAAPSDSVLMKLNTAYLALNGRLALENGAFTGAALELTAEDIFFDRLLLPVVPTAIRPLYERLLPPSRFDLHLRQLQITPTPDGRKNVHLDGSVTLQNCFLRMSGANAECDADLDVNATYKTGHGFENCRLLLKNGRFKILGKSFTNVSARIDYHTDRHEWISRDLKADCYGGKLAGILRLTHSPRAPMRYVLQTGFKDLDLHRFLADTKLQADPQKKTTTGKMNGSLNLSARLGSTSSRIGTCRLSIVDMQLARLSPLAKLLQVFRFAEPTDFAIDRMFVDSYIKADNMIVRKLDLSGRSAAFYGSGSVDLRTRNAYLALIARGKRLATAEPSVLGSLAEGLGQAIFKVDLTGDFYDPNIVARPLPFIQGTLEILGKPTRK